MKTKIFNSGDKLTFPKIEDYRGNLSFIESVTHVPFDIKRVYYLYDVPGGAERGGHAHKKLHQVVIAMAGSFDLKLNDGINSKRVHLNRSDYGIYIGPGTWREMDNFSSCSVCMVIASEYFDESDYIRDYNHFLEYVAKDED